MSGNIKVSGTWRNASNLYVRVGGTWRSALQAYVNVGGSWRLWYNTTISDTFTRANTTTGLGNTESGGSLPWASLIGNFYVSSGTAKSDNTVTAGNAGALSYITLNTPNATAAVGGQTTTAGVGPAVWVSAAGSWWAAIGSNGQTNTTYTYNCNCTCNGHSVCNTCQNAAFGGPYTGDVWYSATAHDEWKVYSNVTTYSNSGATPTANTTTTYSYYSASSMYSATIDTAKCTSADVANPNSSCYAVGVCMSYPNDATGVACTRSCPSGGELIGTTCYNCGSRVNGDLCCGVSANSCYTANSTTTYSCSSGTYYASPPGGCTSGCCTSSTSSQWTSCSQGASFGSSCQGCDSGGTFGYQYNGSTGTWGYFCHYTYTYYGTGTSCAYCGSTFYSGGTANSSTGAGCDSYGFTCQTCTGGAITTNYYMQIIYSTSTGAPYTVYSTSADYGSQISNISVTTSGNTLTATAYGTTGNSLGTLTATNTAAKSAGVGIVKGYSQYNQASTGDNFSATAGAITYIPVEYLVVGGGGGGGNVAGGTQYAGGGGAGGLLSGTVNVNVATAQTVTVGSGGSGGTYASSPHGNNGASSVFGSFTALGGGGGGRGTYSGGCYDSNGSAGGSGGGGPCGGGAGTTGQGYAGATGATGGASGGGGAGGVGTTTGGGPGVSSSITGTAVTYAAGGYTWSSPGTVTGIGSGGHGAYYSSQTSSSGNSGAVILAYANTWPRLVITGTLTYTYSTARTGYHVYTFTGGTGTITLDIVNVVANYLIVGGGGGGGNGGGGGGGYLEGVTALTLNATTTITVGAGGSGGGFNGSNSVLGSITAYGGGGGAWGIDGTGGNNGASGGGGAGNSNADFTRAPAGAAIWGSQGYAGGAGGGSSNQGGGGGGGAGGVGADGGTSTGNGGVGRSSLIATGTSTYYAGGGGGKQYNAFVSPSTGGLGGGANGATWASPYSSGSPGPSAGTANTGGGGGGYFTISNGGTAGYGGSGIVIVAYPTSYGLAKSTTGSPTQTTVSGNYVYKYTGTGSITF